MILKIIPTCLNRFKKNTPPCLIMPRSEHGISRQHIHPNAIKVLYRLHRSGFEAYLVGGAVRDLLLNQTPKDFDVVTNAQPQTLRKLFKNCIIIGRRFPLAHVRFGREVIEVATFRAGKPLQHWMPAWTQKAKKARRADTAYGKNLTDDVWRRDFTINAICYNIADFTLIDHTGGLRDLKEKTLRIIGHPVRRYTQDPVLLLRAIRFAAKLGFTLAPETNAPFPRCAPLISNVPPARLFLEVTKLFYTGCACRSFVLLRQYQVFKYLFPFTENRLNAQEPAQKAYQCFVQAACESTDTRFKNGSPLSTGFLFAVMLWPALHADIGILTAAKQRTAHIDALLEKQQSHTALPKYVLCTTKQIWVLVLRMLNQYRKYGGEQRDKKAMTLAKHARFKAAYDFLLLCQSAHPPFQGAIAWWSDFYKNNIAPFEKPQSAERK